MLAALVVTGAIAIAAAVFAIWPVVADAPWEDEIVVPTPVPVVRQTECERLTQQMADAQTREGASIIHDLGQTARCW